jgi:hypothetical protein
MPRPASVDDYLASLPPDRREAISTVRKLILDNLPEGYEEGIQYGMIGYYVPLSRYPETYNGQPLGIAALASQKGYMSLYLMCVYGDPATRRWFESAYHAAGKRLDMGKSCVRFKRLEDLPLDVVGEAIARVSVDQYLAHYEKSRAEYAATKSTGAAKAKKAAPKKAAKPASAPGSRAGRR